jgi:hypothetical protein
MRRLIRPAPPPRIDPAGEEAVTRLRGWYDEEKPRDHWNDEERGSVPVRDALRTMSGDRCAWCEAALGDHLEVEHYLPQRHFPWLRYCDGESYVPAAVLAKIEDRLLEPTIDDPQAHLEFSPSSEAWLAHTRVGEWTVRKLFSDRSYGERMQRLSELARGWARDGTSEEVVRLTLNLLGYETVMLALIGYWRSFYVRLPNESPL